MTYGVPFVSKLLILLTCKTMLVFRIFTGIYKHYMLVFTLHAGICAACWYLRCMLIFALHTGIYDACWYLRCMLVFALHAGIYDAC